VAQGFRLRAGFETSHFGEQSVVQQYCDGIDKKLEDVAVVKLK
jgi:hypothetical protein